MSRRPWLIALSLLLLPALAFAQLRIVSAAPEGELQTLEQANEVRIVFSEPMIVLGRGTETVTPAWFRIEPSIPGQLRWSGTNILLFRPDKNALRYATPFTVTIDSSARSIHGSQLEQDHVFRFTTPTLRLQRTSWYQKDNGAVVFGLWFNQPVDDEKLLPHLNLALEPHQPELAGIVAPAGAGPEFQAKKNRAIAAARSSKKVLGFIPEKWDEQRLPDAPAVIVVETQPDIPSGAWVKITVGPNAPSPGGPAVPGFEQEFVAQLGPGFFVRRATCTRKCNPDWRHPIEFTEDVELSALASAIRVTDVTDPSSPKMVEPASPRRDEGEGWYDSQQIALEDLGYAIEPAHTYRVVIDPSLRSASGEELGYRWSADLEYWHRLAFTSFGAGHGVWESAGGPQIPFWARNLRTVTQWVDPLTKETLMPAILHGESKDFRFRPSTKGTTRQLRPVPDALQSYGVDVSELLSAENRGLFLAAIEPGQPIPKAARANEVRGRVLPSATIVQATDLGVTLKHSPVGMLVWVTRLSDATPVSGASVEIRNRDNQVQWTGVTDATGIAVASDLGIRLRWWETEFIAIVEKDGDVGYAASNWHQGINPWMFGIAFDPEPAPQRIRGTLFTDRGIYRSGETVHAKLIVRRDTPTGVELYPEGTEVALELRNPRSDVIATTSLRLSRWSSAEWTYTIPANAVFGNWSIQATTPDSLAAVQGSFLVAAYRRPDFRVDVDLGADDPTAGTALDADIRASYLFGGAMSGMPVRWRYTWTPEYSTPQPLADLFPARDFVWTDECGLDEHSGGTVLVRETEARIGTGGSLPLELETDRDAGRARRYTLEAEVTDVSRQAIANRSSFVVHPAAFYVGLRRKQTFVMMADGVDTEIVAATPAGAIVPGVTVNLALTQIQWHSVRRAEGNGFYTWESEERQVSSGSWTVTTTGEPVPMSIPVPRGGYYRLVATATDTEGRTTTSCLSFYAAGEGYTAWQRFDHNRIELVPEKTRYRPGDTARLLIKSPWEHARVLITTERETIRTHRTMELDSTQETIEIPITEDDIPNVFVSVVLVKGRTEGAIDEAGSDPGKPAFRVGYAEIEVEEAAKRLDVQLTPAAVDLRPGADTSIGIRVRTAGGAPADAEVTLWAVDYGVLSLTGYETPDVLDSIWMKEALQVITADSRQKIIARRVMTPKGAGEGGGGGAELGGDAMRKDFRPLAFWLGSIETGADGEATAQVKLPDALTTYRVMAVAATADSRFGSGETEIRTNKPVMLRPTWPRFLSVGDRVNFGAVVENQLPRSGRATATISSLDPDVLEIVGGSGARVELDAKGRREVRFEGLAKKPGLARIEMRVRLGGETDAFVDTIPVLLRISPEVVATYGSVPPDGVERLVLPAEIVPDFGGLRIELASTALVGLSEGARHLITYPFGCAEQRASALFAMLTAQQLGELFAIEDLAIDRGLIETTIAEVAGFQCDGGEFAFWRGNCASASPYVTAWVLHVLNLAKELGYEPPQPVLDRGYDSLERALMDQPGPAGSAELQDTAVRAFAIRELAVAGRDMRAQIDRAWTTLDRTAIFALAWLHDALLAQGDGESARAIELRRRMRNSILQEAGASHVEELNDLRLDLLWSTTTRSTAIVLRSLVAAGEDEQLIRSMVRWLMEVRRNGRWGSTQENAWAMEALVFYTRRFESETPDFAATTTVAETPVATAEFRGRSTEAKVTEVEMPALREIAGTGEVPLTFSREGVGTLHYGARLEWAPLSRELPPLDRGFEIERSYAAAEAVDPEARTIFAAGDLVRVTLRLRVPKERVWVAVSDPIPAGFEPVDAWFRTTASDLASVASVQGEPVERRGREGRVRGEIPSWSRWFDRGGFDHIEKHDDRVDLFATRLAVGEHVFSYLVRATTSGTFEVAPARAEEMYRPENFGRTGTAVVVVEE